MTRRRPSIHTAAQNATPGHDRFLRNLRRLERDLGAELHIHPYRYQNPTSRWTTREEGHEWWDEGLPDLSAERARLHRRLVVAGDLKTSATTSTPIRPAAAAENGSSSLIIPHPRIALKAFATGKTPKIALTTGSCTLPNYSDTANGYFARSAHTLGAVVVSFRGKFFYPRRIIADRNGDFIDLGRQYINGLSHPAPRPLGLTLGDLHAKYTESSTYDLLERIVSEVAPPNIILHDVHDFHHGSHHREDEWSEFLDFVAGESIGDELELSCEVVAAMAEGGEQIWIVRSNHDEHLDRWLKKGHRPPPHNREIYHDLQRMTYAHMRRERTRPHAFELFFKARYPRVKNVTFLGYNRSLMLGGVEHRYHGHRGKNGTRSLEHLATPVTTGHSHCPEERGSRVTVGMSRTPEDYAEGAPSSHMRAHCLQYANGSRTLLFEFGGHGW